MGRSRETEEQKNRERRKRFGRKKKKKKKMRRGGRRTKDQIEQEEEDSDLEGRRKELRKNKKRTCSWNGKNGNSSFKSSIFTWFFFHIRLPHMQFESYKLELNLSTQIFESRDASLLYSFANI